MSRTWGGCFARFTYRALNRRTVEEIRGNITEKGGRNLLSRLVHAKDDKEMLAAWGSDLNRVLHVFNVRSVGSGQQSLTAPFFSD